METEAFIRFSAFAKGYQLIVFREGSQLVQAHVDYPWNGKIPKNEFRLTKLFNVKCDCWQYINTSENQITFSTLL